MTDPRIEKIREVVERIPDTGEDTAMLTNKFNEIKSILDEEEWRPIEGFKGYQVSNTGRVRSPYKELTIFKHTPLKDNSYLCVSLKGKRMLVHRLVAKSFVPNPTNEYCVNHKDGNKSNNHEYNLEWCSLADNNRHAHETGIYDSRGTKNGRSKLNEEQVSEIRDSKEETMDICKKYGVSKHTIYRIRYGKTYLDDTGEHSGEKKFHVPGTLDGYQCSCHYVDDGDEIIPVSSTGGIGDEHCPDCESPKDPKPTQKPSERIRERVGKGHVGSQIKQRAQIRANKHGRAEIEYIDWIQAIIDYLDEQKGR